MTMTQDQRPRITINKRPGQNQCFDEKLGGDLFLRMMQIPGGTFKMGSPEDELDRIDWEGPQHVVTVPSFFMGKYPITQAQWRFVAVLEPVNRELDLDPSRFKGDNRPVERVNWYEAVEFCDRLSRYTSREYRLPTEAEWEYACRAGTTTPFHFGETITTDLANYRGTDQEISGTTYSGSYGAGPKGEYREETTPVDHFGVANGFGFHDMHGNVFEWCLDHWHDSYEGAPPDGSAWLSDNEGANRVIRGGSWRHFPRHCRSASRNDYSPETRFSIVGFRVVCSAPRALQ
jgi:formylglycine-generating enzyme required for sulfatase activity